MLEKAAPQAAVICISFTRRHGWSFSGGAGGVVRPAKTGEFLAGVYIAELGAGEAAMETAGEGIGG